MAVDYWVILGLAAQSAFGARFVVQWIVTERNRKVTIPVAFWYLSLVGGVTLLVYAIHIRDIVFIVGQSGGVFIYLRNLVIHHGDKKLKR